MGKDKEGIKKEVPWGRKINMGEMDKKRQEYAKLLNLLAQANDSVKSSSVSKTDECERLLDAHYLANKFIGHALTILNLSRGTIIQDLPSFPKLNFRDSASIGVLTRAAMEAFLRFHLVFYAPKTTEEKDYRYLVHKVAGIAENQTYMSNTLENEKQNAEEKEALNILRSKLEANTIYLNLKESKRARLFQGQEQDLWRLNPNTKKILHWYEIGIDAGFGKLLARDMYKHLSGYAHSGSLSIIQTANALANKEVEKVIMHSINIMTILTANMIKEYCELFPEAQEVLNNSGASKFIQIYVNVGSRLGENSLTGQDNDQPTHLT